MQRLTVRLRRVFLLDLAAPLAQLRFHDALLRYLPLSLFAVTLVVLLQTLCPTVYSLDSAELATGAAVLGIVHAPGYPLYLLIAHTFTWLPMGDVAFRVNLFSAVCLALTAPVLYSLLYRLTRAPWVAVSAVLTFTWSYYIWSTANKAEIYAPQVLTLALTAWAIVKMYGDYLTKGRVSDRSALVTGLLYGTALAMAPSSIFFAPGVALVFLMMRVRLRPTVLAALLCGAVVFAVMLYFPLRGPALPEFNKIGTYDAQGVFHNFDYHSPEGILKALSAQQFRHLFFAHGLLPSFQQLASTASWLWNNYLGIGVVIGIAGGIFLFRERRGFLLGWAGLALPYTYFYLCYGAIDRDTMFGPSYLAWAILLAFGLWLVNQHLPKLARCAVLVALPFLALVTNFNRVDLSDDVSVRAHAEAVLQSLPPNAVVAGYWSDITPLQYLQFVENQRPDIKIYDLFMFEPDQFHTYVESTNESGETPIVLTNTAIVSVPDLSYRIEPILAYIPTDFHLIELPVLTGFRISK